jgi:hypothetical protein
VLVSKSEDDHDSVTLVAVVEGALVGDFASVLAAQCRCKGGDEGGGEEIDCDHDVAALDILLTISVNDVVGKRSCKDGILTVLGIRVL